MILIVFLLGCLYERTCRKFTDNEMGREINHEIRQSNCSERENLICQ